MGQKVDVFASSSLLSLLHSYTTPPSRSPGSPLAKEHITPNTPLPSTPRHGAFLDVQATPGADLARGETAVKLD